MKRFLVALLAILYLGINTGATVHVHYCMGKMIGASLVHSDDHQCSECGMKKKSSDNGCCKDESKIVKSTDDKQVPATVSFDFSHSPATLPPVAYYYNDAAAIPVRNTDCIASAHAPPDSWRTCPVYIQVRNLRI